MQIEEVFISILNMGITASYAILAVIVLRLFLKKAPGWITLVLWGIASFRLVFPFSLESVLSVFAVIPSADTITPEILYSEAPTIHSGITAVNSAVNPVISESMAPAAEASISPMQIAAYIGSVVWLAGIAALLIYSVVSYIKLKRKTSDATLLKQNVYKSENVASPFLLGFIKPKVYVPYSLSEPVLSHVISHEYSHIKRRDHLLKPLAFAILILHWFNPLVWAAYILFCRDIELACDEKVIKSMSADERKSYSKALLSLAIKKSRIPACPLAFGEVSVKDRVKKALNYKKPAFWIIIIALAACVVTAVCLLTDPIQKAETDSTNTTGGIDTTNVVQKDDTTIIDVSELYGTYHPAEVIYVNPASSFYPYDLSTAPYYTFAKNEFTIVTPGREEADTNIDPKYNFSTLAQSDFYDMFMMDFEIPDISEYDSIQRITVTDEYSIFIVGKEMWLVDTNGGERIWLIYKIEPSEQYSPVPSGANIIDQSLERLSIEELAGIIRNRGNNLAWDDFADLEHYDIGSGLCIWQVPIDESYCLLIGGAGPKTEPMYVRLVKLSAEGEMTDEHLDLLDESTDVQGFFMENFDLQTQPMTWTYNPMISSVFPALPVNIDLRYSTVDVTVDNGSLYSHGDGKTQNLGDTYTYSFGETIYWSPLSKDSYESGEAIYTDAANNCIMSFSIKNGQGDVSSSGKISIHKIGISDTGSSEYSVWLEEAESWMQLTVDSAPERWDGFVITLK